MSNLYNTWIENIVILISLIHHMLNVQAPGISFKKPIGSVTVSGHKFLGYPMPCGIIITRSRYIDFISREVEYIASKDTTISGSRAGHALIFIWYALNKKGFNGLQQEVHDCIQKAVYLQDRLRHHEIGAFLNKFSNTVVFERPQDDEFARKWNLANKGNVSRGCDATCVFGNVGFICERVCEESVCLVPR